MPTYDYECTKCDHTFDAFQSMSDDALLKCPSCSKNGLKRLIGGGLGVIFKGSCQMAPDEKAGQKEGQGRGAKVFSIKSEKGPGSADMGSAAAASGGDTASTPLAVKEIASEKTG